VRPSHDGGNNFRMNGLLILVALLLVATLSFAASNDFSTEQPSPLKLANPRHGRVAHFVGQVRVSGKFFVGWEFAGRKPAHLRAVFFPDADSAKLLPHAAESGPVEELLFADAARAAAILLDGETAQKILAKELSGAGGEAIVTIGNYRTVVECDRRWYLAELLSASSAARIVAGMPENRRFGC
jgi:hypothetical protein